MTETTSNKTTTTDLMNSLMAGGGGDGEHDLFGQIPPPLNGTNQPPDNRLFAEDDEIPFSIPTTPLPEQPQQPPQQPQHESGTRVSVSAEPATVSSSSSSSSPPPTALASPSREAATIISNPAASPPATGPPGGSSSLLSASGLLGMTTSSPPSSGAAAGAAAGGGLFDDIDQQEAAAELEQRRQQQQQQEAERQQQQQRIAQERAEQEQRQLKLQQQQQQQEEAERIHQQQMQEQMQSIMLGPPPPTSHSMTGNYGSPYRNNTPYNLNQLPTSNPPISYSTNNYQQPQFPQNPQSLYGSPSASPQQQPPMVDPPVRRVNETFYRDRNPPPPQIIHTNGSGSRYYQPSQLGSATAGMHGPGLAVPPPPSQPQPQAAPAAPLYARVLVTEPLLLQTTPALFGLGQPPHWSYQLTTELSNNTVGGGVWMVRRRFRHVVALEERLREDCPGAILPPRPDKHATRALEEASTHQSAEFAMQRAAELQVYLNELVHHPIASHSTVLRLFLALQDDLGTAWPEVSSSALTRLASVGVGAAVKVSETTKLPWQSAGSGGGGDILAGMDNGYHHHPNGEDNAELLALQNAESVRMGAVLQAVPKMEGAVTLLREYAEQSGNVGMELSRLAKDVDVTDRELAVPMELVSAGMLRAGRRSKRLTVELAVALQPFVYQHKLCKYERLAFADRREALQRRYKERSRADQRASQLLMHQRQQQHLSQNMMYGGGDRMARDAAIMDDLANDVGREADEIGRRLVQEVNRVAWNRKVEWAASVKVMASSMKEAVSERVAIWEAVRGNFLRAFPEYQETPPPAVMPIHSDPNASFVGGEKPHPGSSPSRMNG